MRSKENVETGKNLIVVPLPPSLPDVRQYSNSDAGKQGVTADRTSSSASRGRSKARVGADISGRDEGDGDDDAEDDDGDGAEGGDDEDDENEGKRKRKVSKFGRGDMKSMSHQQKVERRERNREHAKRSRIRKKVLLDSLQDQLQVLRQENALLRRCVAEKIPHNAQRILEECTTQESLLLSDASVDPRGIDLNNTSGGAKPMIFDSAGQPLQQGAKILVEPDFRLIQALINSQQNFVVSDPSLPDNPIVYASEGFCKLSGYKRQDILGRNCRFLQGPGTDQAAVDIIRKGVDEGCDISVCLLNYKADGSPFWNQFFVAALKDSDGMIVNYVGVQCEVNTLPIAELKDRVKRLPMPDSI